MKKVLLILILLPYLYLSIGYYPFFLIKQQLIKQEIKHKIRNNPSSNEISELIFDKTSYNEINWFEENEFSYCNHLYDVVSVYTSKDNKIHIRCIDDVKERDLIAQIFELRKTNNKNRQNEDEYFFKLFSKEYLKINAFNFNCDSYFINNFVVKTNHYISYNLDKPSPPPKYC